MKKKKVEYVKIEEDITTEVNNTLNALQLNSKINILEITPIPSSSPLLVQITYEQEENEERPLLESSEE